MRIGVIGAMQIEVDNLKASMSDISTKEYSGVTYVCGTIGDKEVVAAVCGIGKVFAAICAEAMILEFHVDYVINIGVGGTLCKELGVMDVAVADKVVQHDMNTTPLGDPVGLLSDQRSVSADRRKNVQTAGQLPGRKRNSLSCRNDCHRGSVCQHTGAEDKDS